MPISLKGLSSGGNAIPFERVFKKSGTFVAPTGGNYLVTVVGAGGSGGAASSGSAATRATGGGAGGFVQKKLSLVAGDVLTFVVGAGGALIQTELNSSNQSIQGNSGGTSSLTAVGVNMVAGGGGGGKSGFGIGQSAGAMGGSASGGSINNVGGGSGVAKTLVVSSNTGPMSATGGGSVGIFRVAGFTSGAAICTSDSTYYTSEAATGGSGVGGKSGDATCTGSPGMAKSVGGTSVGSSINTADISQQSTVIDYIDARPWLRMLDPRGKSNSNVMQAAHAGTGGNSWPNGDTGLGGDFAGGGGNATTDANSSTYNGGGGIGGGSGGNACTNSSGAQAIGNKGGDGCVVIEWFEELK